MKKLFIAALLSVSVLTSAFAKETSNVTTPVLQSFNSEFKNATDVKWTPKGEYTRATFILDKTRMEAFFDKDGAILGTSAAVTVDQLPVPAKRAFAKKYQSYTVKEAIQFTNHAEESYYINAENEKESVVIRIDAANQLSIYSRTNK